MREEKNTHHCLLHKHHKLAPKTSFLGKQFILWLSEVDSKTKPLFE